MKLLGNHFPVALGFNWMPQRPDSFEWQVAAPQ
jgi:hypothetical protein